MVLSYPTYPHNMPPCNSLMMCSQRELRRTQSLLALKKNAQENHLQPYGHNAYLKSAENLGQ